MATRYLSGPDRTIVAGETILIDDANQDTGNDREYLRAWDPITGTVRGQLRDETERLAASLPMSRARIRRWFRFLGFRLAAQPITALFAAIALAAIFGALALVGLNWPVWGHKGNDYAAITLAAGSATAFGAVVFSVTTTAFTRAADMAPGYSVVVLNRRSPWLSGVGIILVSAFLLAFASINPTLHGALAAVLVGVSAVTWSWIAARGALAASDPLNIATDAGRYYRKALLRSARWARSGLATGWPKSIRKDPELVKRLTWQSQQQVVAGMLRQIRAGVLSTAGRGSLTESVMLFEALASALDDYAESVSGEIGPYNGLPDIVLGAADRLIDACIQHDDNEAAQYGIRQIVRIGGKGYADPDYASVRSLAFQRLSSWVDRTWDNDTSTIPAGGMVGMGDLIGAWVLTSAYEDVQRELQTLSKTALRSMATRRIHIGQAATGQLARLFPVLANESNDHLRSEYLNQWTEEVVPLALMAPHEPLTGMAGVVDALVPGMTLAGGHFLQRTIWAVDPPALSDAAGAVLAVLDKAVGGFARLDTDEQMLVRGLTEYLVVAYQTLLVLVANRDSLDGAAQAEEFLALVEAVAESDKLASVLLSPDVAEVVWSILLASSALQVEEASLVRVSEVILGALGVPGSWDPPPLDGAYLRAFVSGLMVITQQSDDAIEAWESAAIEAEAGGGPFGSAWDWGMHIGGLGRSPSTNRNRVTASQSLLDHLNSQAIERFPGLAGGGEAPG